MKHLLLILLISCGNNRKLALYYEFGDERTAQALGSFVPSINDKLGCRAISINENPDHRPAFTIIYDQAAVEAYRTETGVSGVIGWTDHNRQEIVYFQENRLDDYLIRNGDPLLGVKLTLLHEVGHAFWLNHEPLTIMNSVLMLSTEEWGVQSLVDLLNEHKLNPCLKLEVRL